MMRHGMPESPPQSALSTTSSHTMVPPQTPQAPPPPPLVTNTSPSHASPSKATPTKTVLKALPTVRDHTTDQLSPEGDEYVPREYDENGEKKVRPTGHLNDARDYRCRTFYVPHRGDKLFMLATECARVLGYRDSYLLFNKNRSLFKIIATQTEKEDLIHQEILPFSYRSRQIAIVTAKSMFRQFGSRVIVNGRRVRDDYWENKARKQGFTEEDLAGEKRPGGAKARDAAAAEAHATATMQMGAQTDVVYGNSSGHYALHAQSSAMPPSLMGAAALPMITRAPEPSPMPMRDFSNIARPRQEMTGPGYTDRTQSSPVQEMLSQAQNAAEYSKQINSQRDRSGEYLRQRWQQPHEPPSPAHIAPQPSAHDSLPAAAAVHSPRATHGNGPQAMALPPNSQQMMSSQAYTQPPHQQAPMAQTPMRAMSSGSIRPDQLQARSPSMPMGAAGMTNPYANYPPQHQMWNQPQPSPQQHAFPGYPAAAAAAAAAAASQQSPHGQQPAHQPPPAHHRPSMSHMGQMSYPGMQGMAPAYPAQGRNMYQPDQSSQQYMQNASAPAPAGQGQGWANQQPGVASNWGWSTQQQ